MRRSDLCDFGKDSRLVNFTEHCDDIQIEFKREEQGQNKAEERQGSYSLLPYAMPAKGHEVVHAIVGFCNTAKHTSHALGLLGLGHRLETKVCRAVCPALLSRSSRIASACRAVS